MHVVKNVSWRTGNPVRVSVGTDRFDLPPGGEIEVAEFHRGDAYPERKGWILAKPAGDSTSWDDVRPGYIAERLGRPAPEVPAPVAQASSPAPTGGEADAPPPPVGGSEAGTSSGNEGADSAAEPGVEQAEESGDGLDG